MPVKEFFSRQGYIVKGEVHNCDIAMTKGDELFIIELKLQFGIKLIYQAIDRQSLSPNVFMGIARPKTEEGINKAVMLSKRIGLGLLTVAPNAIDPVWLHCLPTTGKRVNQRARKALLDEFNARVGDNIGGTTRTKRVTAYKEACIRLLYELEAAPLSLKELKALGHSKAQYIVANNYYGWFERRARGIYGLSERGYQCITEDRRGL